MKHRDLVVQMQPEEVGAYAWLDRDAVSVAVGLPGVEEDATFAISEFVKEGAMEEVEKSVFTLAKQYETVEDMGAERLSSGTLFALTQWILKTDTGKNTLLPPEV